MDWEWGKNRLDAQSAHHDYQSANGIISVLALALKNWEASVRLGRQNALEFLLCSYIQNIGRAEPVSGNGSIAGAKYAAYRGCRGRNGGELNWRSVLML